MSVREAVKPFEQHSEQDQASDEVVWFRLMLAYTTLRKRGVPAQLIHSQLRHIQTAIDAPKEDSVRRLRTVENG